MNYNLSTTGSMGVTASAFRPALTRAQVMSSGHASMGITSVTGSAVATFVRALTMPPPYQTYIYPIGYVWIYPNSLGVSGTAFTPAISRALAMALVYSGYPLYQYISSGSFGVNTSSNFKLATNRALYDVAQIGIDPKLFLPLLVRALSGSNPLGVNSAGNPAINRAAQTTASLGVTGFARFSRVFKITSLGSLGVTATVTPTMVRALISSGSIGISLPGGINVNRALRTLASMGITGTVVILSAPSGSQPNVIILFEATDTSSPTAYSGLLPRDYQRIYLDQTVSSYPQPFTLRN